ncbi:peptide chain release factor N(5)-glutamine methyltransferase [Helicobacter mustelae]|uniref:peptide chain release factor N(5)-glutamine methyltransferase n=1 Tax=Helicobacter mustelae (strain ATCC 43772 / CCUG 25715 / CIP 103759 / LMG 18044 / NCTC 12198 / R85-136P) TaxID=679897 RepID=D3UG36_HELM1|nr:peptide chain release factor N(5)-glutamine methyltransferase [Helicobacter mustelae]CBG39457.1 putative S-adenosylmethionine-dependent methyltransferase [Helicobacter mustelae 12198]SQH70968.1 S-adenosylmethionine-dependent methyltransferase [Helicobacter mustelae]
MKISQALLEAKKQLLQHSIPRPLLESEILLGFVLKTTRQTLHAWGDREIAPKDLDHFFEALNLREQGNPIEYITKEASFYEHIFYVDHRVLIPRPETELLIDAVDFLLQEHGVKNIAEVGVGSGIISITLALKYKDISLIATDISKDALDVATCNIAHFHTQENNLKNKIKLVHTNLLDGVKKDSLDLLIANPPYIARSYPLEPHVLLEPHCALFGGERGDEILLELIEVASTNKIKFLACEMGFDQKESLQEALKKAGYRADFYQDYAGLDRGFVAKKIS